MASTLKECCMTCGLPGITKDELRTIVVWHVTAEIAAVCVTKVGHVNTLSIKKSRRKKR